MDLSNDQKQVIRQLFSWLATRGRSQVITVGGYAGTGKTTLVAILRQQIHRQNPKLTVAFCAYTGKAARVLRLRLAETGAIFSGDEVGTIHSLIYKPKTNSEGSITGWQRKDELKADLVVVDEASMVDGQIWQDLREFGKPIIAVGDHGQLPPINGEFNLMDKPDLVLEKIHRQAEGSPIIHLSMLAREEGKIAPGVYGPGVEKVIGTDPLSQDKIGDVISAYKDTDLILCGYNNTRVRLNKAIREHRELFTPHPTVRDRVICLKNNHEKQIYNGMLGTVLQYEKTDDENWAMLQIAFDDEDNNFSGLAYLPQFNNAAGGGNDLPRGKGKLKGDIFDFGYALTVHKAQGSQAKRVVVFEERFAKMSDLDWKRWLYTAITRAQERLLLIGS
jgi:exodeoxyribonuclease-5